MTTDSEESSGATGNKDPLNAFRYTGKRYDTGSDSLDMGAYRGTAPSSGFDYAALSPRTTRDNEGQPRAPRSKRWLLK